MDLRDSHDTELTHSFVLTIVEATEDGDALKEILDLESQLPKLAGFFRLEVTDKNEEKNEVRIVTGFLVFVGQSEAADGEERTRMDTQN